MTEMLNAPTGDITEFGTGVPSEVMQATRRPAVPSLAEESKKVCSSVPFLRQWAKISDDEYTPVGECKEILPAGLYDFYMSNKGPIFVKKTIQVDTLIHFPDSLSESVLQEINRFWSSKEAFSKYGFLQRRGYMLYGPQGSGKSCLVQQIVKGIIDLNGLAFMCNKDAAEVGGILSTLRIIEPERPIVCLFEDIDAIIHNKGEAEILSLLDGEIQISNVLNIATTNYPERLDKRIIARPRRFDRLIKVNMPEARIRRIYLEHKLKDATPEEIDLWVSSTEKFSFAALADLVISVKCLGNPFEDTVAALKKLQTKSVSSKEFDTVAVGFGNNGHNGEEEL
jgi:hypothetical protein